MPNIIVSDEKLNTSAIALSSKWYVPIDVDLLNDYVTFDNKYYNWCKISNNSPQNIKAYVGNSTVRIPAGDGYEFTKDDAPVHFQSVTIEELDGVQIAIGKIIVEYARVR